MVPSQELAQNRLYNCAKGTVSDFYSDTANCPPNNKKALLPLLILEMTASLAKLGYRNAAAFLSFVENCSLISRNTSLTSAHYIASSLCSQRMLASLKML